MSGTVAGTTPYSWPYDGRLDPTRLALLVVLPGPEDAEAAADGAGCPDSALGRFGVLAGAMFAVGGVVVEVTTTPPPGRRPGIVAAPRRAADLGLRGPAHRITAGGLDGFFASALDATLRALGRDQLVLCGQWLEIGVHSTMRSANDRGYECLLVLDACIPYDPNLVPAARSQVEMSGGIFGAVGDTAAVLAALHAVSNPDQNLPERTPA
jgi:hypothetical protein